MDIEDVMNYLVDERAEDLSPLAFSEMFMSLSYYLLDGDKVLGVARKWLTLDDEYRAAISLGLEDVFPADSRAGLVELSASIRERFPALAEAAEVWVERWDKSYGARRDPA
ncbi:hypothetical protein [Micromonospora pisi]|uniref:hypothetical protein n=1 Tax=Micromonospora pisi TaxID=589240 RepID=UPI000EB2D76E|nr:hypothetical protein [Micromonospora pisi]